MIFILHFSLGWNISCLGYILITYLLEAVLDGSNFPAKVTAHWHKVGLLSVQVIRIPPHIFQHLSKNVEISHKITVFQVESKRFFFFKLNPDSGSKIQKVRSEKMIQIRNTGLFLPYVYMFYISVQGTTFMVKFEESVIARDKAAEWGEKWLAAFEVYSGDYR